MTDTDQTEKLNIAPDKGKWWFFDIFNKKLDKNDEKKAKNDRDLANANRHLDNAKASAKKQMSDGKKAVESLIKNRVEMGKARLKNGCINTRETLLGWREKAAMFKATAKALFKFDAQKDVLKRVEDAQKGVADKYGAKRESLLAKRKDVKKIDGSIGRNVKSVLKGEVKSFMVSAKKRKVKRSHKFINRKLNVEKNILNCLGILTSPAKLATDVTKYTANKLKQGYDYVTDVNNLQKAAEGLGYMAASVQQSAKKIGADVKRKNNHIRWVARDKARDFRKGAKKRLNAGLNFAKNVVRGIKETPGKTWASLKGCYKTTAKMAKDAYDNSALGKLLSAVNTGVRTGYNAGLEAYANANSR